MSHIVDQATDMMPKVAYTPKVSTQADIVTGTTDIARGIGGQINTDQKFQTSVLNAIYSGRGAILNIIG